MMGGELTGSAEPLSGTLRNQPVSRPRRSSSGSSRMRWHIIGTIGPAADPFALDYRQRSLVIKASLQHKRASEEQASVSAYPHW